MAKRIEAPWTTERAEELNWVIRQYLRRRGLNWDPVMGEGIWVEEYDGQLYICDHNWAASYGEPLNEKEATPSGVLKIARAWVRAVKGR